MNISRWALLAGCLAACGTALLAPRGGWIGGRRGITAGPGPNGPRAVGRRRSAAQDNSLGVRGALLGRLGALRARFVGGPGPAQSSAAAHARLAEELAALAAAGLDPRAAWSALDADSAAAASGTIRAVQAMIGAGGGISEGLRAATDPYARWLAVAWHVSSVTGAPLSGVLDELASGLRRHVDAHRARAAAIAGPKATSRVLSAMPAMGLALAALIGLNPFAVLVGSSAGRVSLVLGVLAWAAGHVWSAALVRRLARRA